MPKIKTNKSAAKRFKRTGSGKYSYSKANSNHILTKKTRKRKRLLRSTKLVNKNDIKRIKLLLPNG